MENLHLVPTNSEEELSFLNLPAAKVLNEKQLILPIKVQSAIISMKSILTFLDYVNLQY